MTDEPWMPKEQVAAGFDVLKNALMEIGDATSRIEKQTVVISAKTDDAINRINQVRYVLELNGNLSADAAKEARLRLFPTPEQRVWAEEQREAWRSFMADAQHERQVSNEREVARAYLRRTLHLDSLPRARRMLGRMAVVVTALAALAETAYYISSILGGSHGR